MRKYALFCAEGVFGRGCGCGVLYRGFEDPPVMKISFNIGTTNVAGEAVPCAERNLSLSVSLGFDSEGGIYTGIDRADVHIECQSSGAEVAMVLDCWVSLLHRRRRAAGVARWSG
ncbi:MAG: hypothetical protein HRU17_08730 [Polyangiaceae bacterium]|nr:hypothetical protein [Polyangiaceae bacterium]